MKRYLQGGFFLYVTLTILACSPGAAPDEVPTQSAASEVETVEVRLLAFNDFHGALEGPAGTVTLDGERVDAGGVAYLAAHIDAARGDTEHSIVIAAGDLIGASPLVSALFQDEPSIEALGLAGLEISSVGNHEFDEGVDELLRIANGGCHAEIGCEDGQQYQGAPFSYLAANVGLRETGEAILPAYEIRDFGGIQIAFVGMTLEETPKTVVPSAVASLNFYNEVETLSALMPELEEKGVDSVVLLLHSGGIATEEATSLGDCPGVEGPIVAIAEEVDPAVSVVVSGHTHQAYICEFGDKLVTGAMSHGRVLTVIDLEFDAKTGELLQRQARQQAVTHEVDAKAEVAEVVEAYQALSEPVANRPVGAITAPFPRGDRQGAGESPMGWLIADAQLAATADETGAQIAFMNPGGIRGGLDVAQEELAASEGAPLYSVSFAELHAIQPFGNVLTTMSLTGDQIHELLENQWREDGHHHVLAVSSGFSYAFNPDAPVGERVAFESITLGGEPLEREKSYRVTVNNFMADGGDGFEILTKGIDRAAGPVDLDALVAYFQEHTPLTPLRAQRIRVVEQAAAE